MLTFNSLDQNHNFLILETIAQFGDGVHFFEFHNTEVADRMRMRNELIRNMKNTQENDCFQQLFSQPGLPGGEVQRIRAQHRIAQACRRIANHCVNMCDQALHMNDSSLLERFALRDMTRTARESLARIPTSLDLSSEEDAVAICRSEDTLDKQYDAIINAVSGAAKLDPEAFRDHMVVILVARYLEAVGDELLRIGEALLSAMVGDRIQFYEYEALRRGLERIEGKGAASDMSYKAFWGSRSGCVIGRVTSHGRRAIFKEGPVEKVRQEKENMLGWSRAVPGIVPEVYVYSERNGLGSLLMEEIAGTPMDEILLGGSQEQMERASLALVRTLRDSWARSLEPTGKPAGEQTGYMAQMLARMDKIRQVHPELGVPPGRQEQVLERIVRAGELERTLPAPFSVFIHGDFNLNNIFFDQDRDAVRYVDLYRSRRGDYIQDVSVHLVSYFRVPVFGQPARGRIFENILKFQSFASEFARLHQDVTMEARLTLGLARSLITSTRFELRRTLATVMFSKAYAMLDSVLEHAGKDWKDFTTPLTVLDLGRDQ